MLAPPKAKPEKTLRSPVADEKIKKTRKKSKSPKAKGGKRSKSPKAVETTNAYVYEEPDDINTITRVIPIRHSATD